MFRVRVLVVVLGLALVAGLAPPAAARSLEAEGDRQRQDTVLAAVVEASSCDAGVAAVEQRFGLTGGSLVAVRCEPTGSSPHGISPQWTVGLGWYSYVYLDRGDWIWLAGLGFTAASAALCFLLTGALGPAVACAVAAYIVGNYVIKRAAPPAGYCAEFKFTYVTLTSAGYKLVKRRC